MKYFVKCFTRVGNGDRVAHSPRPRATICATLLFIAVVVFASNSAFAAQTNLEFSRADYGYADYSIWSELTPLERDTLSSAENFRRGDGDALLALYLIASGDARDYSDFRRAHSRIDKWLKRLQPALNQQGSEKQKASLLYKAMHEEFFVAQKADDELATGYDLDQSKLSDVFRDGTFNCISSSLLYIVVAQKIGLRTKAVLLPSHSFVEIHLDSGDVVEVETTSLHGFDLVHDADFYEPRHQDWFIERQLEPLTYAQYLNREIIDAHELGLYNMWSQHTKPERMSYRDRMRLAEIRAVLQPNDLTIQKTRLSFYNQEFNFLHERGDYETLARMFEHISPLLEQAESTLLRHAQNDQELQNLLAWLNSQRALTLINTGQRAEGLALVKHYLQTLSPTLDDYQKIQDNLYLVLANYLHESRDAANYDQAKAAMSGFENVCLNNSACANGLAGLYAGWGKHYWQQEDWEGAINVYHQYLHWDRDSSYVDVFRSNFEKAHINWAREALQDEEWQRASDILERCTLNLEAASQCEARLRNLREQVHLDEM